MAKTKAKKKISKNLVIAIIAILILVFVGIYFFSDAGKNNEKISEDVVVSVNGEEINSDEISLIQQSFLQQGQEVSNEEAIEQAINQKLLSQEIQESGIVVTNEEAESAIEQQLALQGATLDDFKQQLEMQGLSYQDEVENVKDQIATQNYLKNSLEGQDFQITDEEAKEFYDLYKSQSLEELPPYEELKAQIIQTLEQQKQQEIINSLIQELRLNSDIKYY